LTRPQYKERFSREMEGHNGRMNRLWAASAKRSADQHLPVLAVANLLTLRQPFAAFSVVRSRRGSTKPTNSG
jgi:hypothetical protein